MQELPSEQTAARRAKDPERVRAQDRERKALQRRVCESRDRIVLGRARRKMRLFCALVWEELKPELSTG
jgi:hypothetical protein